MKFKFLVLCLAVCIALCACGNSESPNTEKKPSTGETTVAPTDANEPTSVDDLIQFTFPEDMEGQDLPMDYFDDVEVVISSRPLDTEVPDPTEPATQPPTTPDEEPLDNGNGDELPFHDWS